MLENKKQEIIDLEDNYQLCQLKFRAEPTLYDFIMQNAHKKESSIFRKNLKRLYGDQFEKITFFKENNFTEYVHYVKDVTISFLCQIDEAETQKLIQNVKIQAIKNKQNQYTVQKKKSQIKSKQIYEHLAIHFLMYFCKGSFGSIYQLLKKIRQKIKYEIQEQGQVFDFVSLPSVDFPINIKNKYQCYCQMDSSPKQQYTQNILDILHCEKCYSRYHTNCQLNVLNCSSCNLSFNYQKSKIKEKLNLFYIFPNKSINAICFKILNLEQDQLQPTLKYSIEIRVQRVNNKISIDSCSAVFMSKYNVILNGQAIKLKSELLKNGQPIRISNKYLAKNNILIIKKNFKQKTLKQSIDKSSTFIIGIFKVQKGKISVKPSHITMLQSKTFLKSICTSLNLLQLNVSLIDQNTASKIFTPVRGKNCKHFNCFDLKGFKDKNKKLKDWFQKSVSQSISGDNAQFRSLKNTQINMELVKNLKNKQIARQTCPICQQRVNHLLYDPLFQQIINSTNSKTISVQLKYDGTFFPNDKGVSENQNSLKLFEKKFKQYKKSQNQPIDIQSDPQYIELD